MRCMVCGCTVKIVCVEYANNVEEPKSTSSGGSSGGISGGTSGMAAEPGRNKGGVVSCKEEG